MPIPHCEFICGAAGTGKSTLLNTRMSEARNKGQRNYATLTASTGIAAINLSGDNLGQTVTTINSELGYFDLASLKDNFASRRLHGSLKNVAKKGRNLVIDEISMFGAESLDLIYDATEEINELAEVSNRGGLGIILSGDFLQLPPINAPFAFTAKCWNKFSITKLTKIWRQTNVDYLAMLNSCRNGDGSVVSRALFDIQGINIRGSVDSHFDGTTLVAINKLVDSMNHVRLCELLQDKVNTKFEFNTIRWGKQRGEWKLIPDTITVARNAYVMILANDAPKFTYANGSCGYIKDAWIDTGTVFVKLKSNGSEVRVRRVTRKCFQKDTPEGCIHPDNWMSKKEYKEHIESGALESGVMESDSFDVMYKTYLMQLTASLKVPGKPYFDFLEDKWVVGEIIYTPVRLAYATTCHKAQGLSLDAVQIDLSHAFFNEPSMMYVALSRCRTPEGLTLVGNRKLFEDRCNISSEVVPWI